MTTRESKNGPTERDLCITGIGVVSPVGHTSQQSCTSIRAGITRVAESEEFQVADESGTRRPATCAAVAGVTDGQRRFLRHLRLAVPALREALEQAQVPPDVLRQAGLYLCLQEPNRPGMDDRPEKELASRLERSCDLDGIGVHAHVYSEGHAGIFHALADAHAALQSGEHSIAIVGAVDTYLDEITMEWLLNAKRMKSESNSTGFWPGEAAVFMVAELSSFARRRRAELIACVYGVHRALEPFSVYHDEPCRAEGLTRCLQDTLSAVTERGGSIGLIVCDLNGEHYRALEWGLARSRVLAGSNGEVPVTHPAENIGDVGAASGGLGVAYAAYALRSGIVKGGDALVWASSDDGERGSLCVRLAS